MSKELQGILVQLLKEVDEICRKNDIRYYIWGGTCIGQIRHGGFIPWDDDIDIVMPREDYEKFEKVIETCMPEGRDLISYGRYKTYTNPIPRYMDLNTTALRTGRLGDGTSCGECIEIFILDPMPRDPQEQEAWKKLLYVYCEVLCTAWIQAKRKLRKDFVDVDLYKEYRKKLDSLGREGLLKLLEDKLFNIEEKDSDVYCLRWMPRSLYEIPIRCYGEPQDVIYEGMTVYGPERPAEMLQLYIGNSWRNLLPPEARDPHPTLIHHNLACGNCEREFHQIKSDEEMAQTMQEFKDLGIDYYKLRNETYVDRARPSMKYAKTKAEKAYEKYGREQLMADSALTVKVMSDYISMQRSALFKHNDLFIPLADEIYDVLVKSMFEEAMLQQVFDILHIRHKNAINGIEMTTTQCEYYRAAKDFLKMVVHADEKEYEQSEEIYNKYVKIYPEHRCLYRTKLDIDWKRADANTDFAALAEYAHKGLALYPDDDMLNKRYADCLLKLGDSKAAEEIYHRTARSSINGLLLREMKEYGIEEAELKLDAKVWKFD